MGDLKASIAKAKAGLGVVKTQDTPIVVGGDEYTATVEKLLPDEWDALVMKHPPRQGSESDAMVGYNQAEVTINYPRLMIDGDMVDAETMREMYSVMDSTWRNGLGAIIWGVNVNESLKELRALGKARAGRK